ncbi:hypothetical protein [Nonomuraea rubra]|uniref:Uncharacterized protein n=1 Tax=Nonomuraea rubra TaxID=46180 RepID=A0A7X0U6S8_9ACTN|nr:hypothetical protein [Nonomuraea rubra]MBB6557203.1 hypothetical protein [Nonomuraea rubra]
MQAVLTSLVAILGTVVGSVITFIFQRKAAERAEIFARNEWLLQQRMETYSTFSQLLMDLRAAQYNRWYRLRDDPDGEGGASFIAARDESYRLRAAAGHALFRVQLLAHDPRLVNLANEAVRLAAEMPKCRDKGDLEARGDEVKLALEAFVKAAAGIVSLAGQASHPPLPAVTMGHRQNDKS